MTKEKRTEQLIQELSLSNKPKRLLPAPVRAGLIVLFTLIYIALVAYFIYDPRPNLLEQYANLSFTLEQLCALAIGGLAAFLATRYSVPGKEQNIVLNWVVAILTVGLIAFVGYGNTSLHTEPNMSMILMGMHCAFDICVFAVPPAGVALYMILKAAPTRPLLTGFFTILSMFAFAYFGIRTICPMDDIYHQATAHVLPLIIFSAAGFWIGHKLLRW